MSLALAFLLLSPMTTKAQEKDPRERAQAILDEGAALYDTRDAGAMAATYTEDAQLLWFQKDDTIGQTKMETKKGRAEIESVYRDLYKDAKEKTTSRNTVESARLVTPDLMIIEGVFQPNIASRGKFPFVQVREKHGDKWLMKSLQLFLFSQD
jgi:hypothetical protein